MDSSHNIRRKKKLSSKIQENWKSNRVNWLSGLNLHRAHALS